MIVASTIRRLEHGSKGTPLNWVILFSNHPTRVVLIIPPISRDEDSYIDEYPSQDKMQSPEESSEVSSASSFPAYRKR